jgi:hypothetical protein
VILHVVGRVIVVPLGFLLGAGVAMAVLLTLGLEVTTHAFAGREPDADMIEAFFRLAHGFVSLAAVATVVPALLAIVIGEVARIRSVLYYVLSGGLALAALPLMARLGGSGGGDLASTRLWTVFATAGFAGGAVYWLIAGRRA